MVSPQAIWKRRRYADPDFREKARATKRAYWATHKDAANARLRERRKTDPKFREREREYRARRYGMSIADYDALLARQGGVCAICRQKSDRRLKIDHCHVTNQVRGLLCHQCNVGLGNFDDDTDRMRMAIEYLENSRREEATDPGSTVLERDSSGAPVGRQGTSRNKWEERAWGLQQSFFPIWGESWEGRPLVDPDQLQASDDQNDSESLQDRRDPCSSG
jgi:Recombination endonuclease VII